jgi:hypothetical protein
MTRRCSIVLGVILIFGGLAMVLVHNIWRGGAAPVIVTMIGWLTLAKGLLLIGVAPAQPASLYLQELRDEQMYPVYTVIAVGSAGISPMRASWRRAPGRNHTRRCAARAVTPREQPRQGYLFSTTARTGCVS